MYCIPKRQPAERSLDPFRCITASLHFPPQSPILSKQRLLQYCFSLKLCCTFKNPVLLCIQHLLHSLSKTTYISTSVHLLLSASMKNRPLPQKKVSFLIETFLIVSFYKAGALYTVYTACVKLILTMNNS